MSRQWLYLLFTQKLEVLDIVSSFIKTVHYVPGHALLADGLTVKSFFSNRKAQIHSFRFYTELLKTLKLMLSNAVFLFKTISSCKKTFTVFFTEPHNLQEAAAGRRVV